MLIVTDYRLNANHNIELSLFLLSLIVTDYRLNANHNSEEEKEEANEL
ncbi:Helicase loader DnaI [bacterium endosymbiont of Bathymodiolus sp. 5 South]|nr:Helicase loader DnaI [bacterium endosymbiont of Bathymodiolus sp. 5 South]